MPPRPTRTHPRSHDSPNRSSSSYEDAGPLNAQLTPSRSSSDPDREEEDVLGEQGHAAEIFRLRPMPRRIDDDNDRKGSGAMDADGEEDEGQHFLSEQGRRQSDSASVASFELYTPDEGRAVLKKLDRRVVVLLALLYLLSFLDRSSMCDAAENNGDTLWLTSRRHWKCPDCGAQGRSSVEFWTVRMGFDGILYYLYFL